MLWLGGGGGGGGGRVHVVMGGGRGSCCLQLLSIQMPSLEPPGVINTLEM